MKKIFNRLKKVKPNHLILFNIIFIMVVFGGINKYNNNKYPVKSEKKIDGIKYTVLINRHKYSKDSLMLINLNIQNSGRKKKEIEIKRENIFNVEIYSNDKLIYKRDFMDKLSGKTNVFRMSMTKNFKKLWKNRKVMLIMQREPNFTALLYPKDVIGMMSVFLLRM